MSNFTATMAFDCPGGRHYWSLEGETVCGACGEMHPVRKKYEQLADDNRELFQEVMTGINDTARLAKENLELKARDSVRAYERLGGENLGLIERVRDLEAALFAATEEIADLCAELTSSAALEDDFSWETESEDD